MFFDLFNSISDFAVGDSITIISLILGLIFCFNGYNLFKFFVRINGFIIFAIIGIFIGLFGEFSTELVVITAIGLGIIGVLLSFKFYKFMVFMTVSFGAYTVIITLVNISIIASILSAVVGSLALMFFKPVVSISSASYSGVIIASSLAVLIPVLSPFELIIFIAFAILGSLKQLSII